MSELPRNLFKAALQTGKPQYGLWLGISDQVVAEMMAGAGFDWVLIDHEHGTYELRDVLSHLQAIAPYDVAPVVRPVDGNPALLKRLCDIGAQSFLVPMVDTPEQAADIVAAVKYPPQGRRGLGTSMARAARWNTVPGYLTKANDEILVIVQAETIKAIDNLEAIANTPGVDGVFIGPSDLSASMGYVGQAGHPDVVEAVGSGLKTIRTAGKYAGLMCLDKKQVSHFVDCGASFVAVGVDTLLIGNSARALAASYKSGDGSDDAGY